MTDFATWLFLVGMIVAAIPHIAIFWFLWKSWHPDNKDTATLGRTLYWLTLAQIIFYFAQFATVMLGVIGLGENARIPAIILVDGSLILIAIANWYTLYKVMEIQKGEN